MSSARDDILARIRKANGATTTDPAEIAAQAANLLAAEGLIQPQFDDLSNRAKFIERATSERLTATVDEVANWAEAVGAVRAYLMRSNIPLELAMPPIARLAELDWGEIRTRNKIAPNEVAALGLADFAIAETGTLVFSSRADSPTLFNFLGLHHIVLVEAEKVLRYMEDFWRLVRDAGNVHPHNINFVTGTSGTADIEAKNTRGAHGPRYLHIVIIGEKP